MEPGSAVGCDGPFAKTRFWLPKPSVLAPTRQPRCCLSPCARCPPRVAVRRRVLAVGMELGAPGLGGGLSPSPVAVCLQLLFPLSPRVCSWGVTGDPLRCPEPQLPGGVLRLAGLGGGTGGCPSFLRLPSRPLPGFVPCGALQRSPGGSGGDRAGGTACAKPPQWLCVCVAAGEHRDHGSGAGRAGFGSPPKARGRKEKVLLRKGYETFFALWI